MTPRRRAALLIAAGLLVLALTAAPALAAAGGGSSGFGGGGGGGGGGGRGAGLYILIQLLVRIAILGHGLGLLVVIGLIVAYALFANVAPKARAAAAERAAQGHASRRRTDERRRRARLAAAEAAEEDPAFAADRVESAARDLFAAVQAAWSADDRGALGRLVSPGLLGEWSRRLDDFARRGWRNRVELESTPRATLVGIRRGTRAPTATVRIEAALRDYVVDRGGHRITRTSRFSERTRVREYWTLAREADRWTLQRIEQGAEGAHALEERLIPTPWADTEALSDAARLETAETTDDHAGLASATARDPRAAALDLSLVDDRFAPDVIDIAVRRVLAGWAEAVDAGPSALDGLATPAAARALLLRDGRVRIVVRDPRLEGTSITRLDAEAHPATVAVEARIVARRYAEDRDTGQVLGGSATRDDHFTRTLTFALGDAPERPWQLVAAA